MKLHNYIGKKGFTVHKNECTQTELYEIRSAMTMKPNASMPGLVSHVSYPIYRESSSKIYLPRYYGIDTYGNPEKNLLRKGEIIDCVFKGSLFDYQLNIVQKYIDHVGESGGGLLDVEPGKGKTVMALYIISKLAKKTLVVVHKSFLLNQWKERIQQFIPAAKIGIIQGQTCDIEGKDIVIGMLQTLCTRKFSENIIEKFGLSVYDECHHLSAEVFCNCMVQIVTNYNLGLSGTMTRKDGLTKVFKYFIGPVVHKEKTDNNTQVLIKSYLFEDPENEEYNEVERDYRGNPMYSRMITKLCNNTMRTSVIVNIIKHELKVNYDQQIMILAHNKSLIKTLYEQIEIFESSIGYYVGGMKEQELKSSESKKVIIATYAMASEGLDIKTLTTLLMATPKSDVCQSVGRILRSKHRQPVVIDVVDVHDIFKNQYQKRKAYYKKKNYVIHSFLNLTTYFDGEYTVQDFAQNNLKTKKKKPQCLIQLN